MPQAEVFAAGITHHGEGAVWWPGTTAWPTGHLRLVDGYEGELVDLFPDGTRHRTQVGRFAACVRPRVGGGAVVGTERGFALLDATGTLHPATELLPDDIRMNDGGCDPAGNFWCGSMAWDGREGAGTLYRLDDSGDVTVQLQDASVANGLDWAPNGTTVFWNDTPTQTVWQFDYAWDVGLVNRRPFVHIDPDDGGPDGLTVDRTGAVWVAMWGGGAVRRYDVDGRLDTVVDVGARQVSSCTIGGTDLDRLYVTTSRENLDDGDDPLAGSVFTLDLGESLGSPARPYGG
ncbi:SMP-30/gluconolactonase/LRE family protein [Jatrophihabitans sp. YIM 134969]